VSIVEAFYPGSRGGLAIAKTLFGQGATSTEAYSGFGRLPYTVYQAVFVNETKMTQVSLSAPPGLTYRF
jgi:hypothetical protein